MCWKRCILGLKVFLILNLKIRAPKCHPYWGWICISYTFPIPLKYTVLKWSVISHCIGTYLLSIWPFLLCHFYTGLWHKLINVWPEQRLLAATVNPHKGEGHPDTLRSSCTSSSTTQTLWTGNEELLTYKNTKHTETVFSVSRRSVQLFCCEIKILKFQLRDHANVLSV